MKFKQALKAIEACACAWVEYGVSVRDLSLIESIQARNEQARKRAPLAPAELRDLTFEPPVSGIIAYKAGRQMVLDATAMCAGYYHPSAA
jgi:hypothetical protein